MVQKCVDAHNELTVNQTRIEHVRDGVCVDVKITLAGGVNIPLTVNALQKQIKQYITSCSGVDVQEVRVMVETDVARLQAPAEEPALDVPVEETAAGSEKAAEQICQHVEEPMVYAGSVAEDKPDECLPAEETAEEPQEETEMQPDETVAEESCEASNETEEEQA